MPGIKPYMVIMRNGSFVYGGSLSIPYIEEHLTHFLELFPVLLDILLLIDPPPLSPLSGSDPIFDTNLLQVVMYKYLVTV